MIVTLFRDDFWRHVLNCATVRECASRWRPVDVLLAQSKVNQLDEALRIEQNVFWFQITENDALNFGFVLSITVYQTYPNRANGPMLVLSAPGTCCSCPRAGCPRAPTS